MNNSGKPLIKPSRPVRRARKQLTAWWSAALLCGCAGHPPSVLVIPADREIQYLPADRPLTSHPNLYLIPPARMQEILRALSDNPTTEPAVPHPPGP
jgi:hypothetical protein